MELLNILPIPIRQKICRILNKIESRTPVCIRNLGAKLNPDTIFICGNYKTGSSAIASLLAIATRQNKTIDLFWRTPGTAKIKLLQKELPLEWYIHRYRYLFAKKIVKEPDLIFYLDQLMALFPQAQYVFLLRDPRDNIRSILSFLKLPGNANDLTKEQIQQTPGSIWKLALDGSLFGTKGPNYIATQALRWNRILDIYEQYKVRMFLLKYETFLQDKVQTIHNLAAQLGLSVQRDIRPFLNRPYQPKGDYAPDWLAFYGPENLAQIEQICREKMLQYGYPLTPPTLQKNATI